MYRSLHFSIGVRQLQIIQREFDGSAWVRGFLQKDWQKP